MADFGYGCNSHAYDFEYAGFYLSDFGFVVCDFDSSSGTDIASAGSVITFNTVPRNKGKIWSLTSTQYDECIQTTIQICKNPNLYEDLRIDNDEYRSIMRWLNRREFLKFRLLTDDNTTDDTGFYMASFNVSKIKIQDVLYGLELTMETDKPFAYGEPQRIVINAKDTEREYDICDVSDEIGSIYPSMKITCNGSGDLMIYNDLENCTTEIKNCSEGEVITIDGDALFIETSLKSHTTINNDFNYCFFRIGNTYDKRNNRITVSLPCDIELSYMPVIKDAP